MVAHCILDNIVVVVGVAANIVAFVAENIVAENIVAFVAEDIAVSVAVNIVLLVVEQDPL